MTLEGRSYIVLEFLKLVELGSVNALNATLYNVVTGPDIIVRFESTQLGNITLTKTQDDRYHLYLSVPVVPECYPVVEGQICVYDKNNKILESSLSFNTSYELDHECLITNNSRNIFFYIKGSLRAGGKSNPISFATACVDAYKDGVFLERKFFTRKDLENSSEFTTTYAVLDAGNYYFIGYLQDGFSRNAINIFNKSCSFFSETPGNEGGEEPPATGNERPLENNTNNNTTQILEKEMQAAIPSIVGLCSTSIGTVVASTFYKRKFKIRT
jgi:hypothetical protein